MIGNTYTIVDMNVWGWARLIPTGTRRWRLGEVSDLKRLVDAMDRRRHRRLFSLNLLPTLKSLWDGGFQGRKLLCRMDRRCLRPAASRRHLS